MNLSKEQLHACLKKLKVSVDGRLGQDALEKTLKKELKDRGFKLRKGELYKDATQKDLDKNPELVEKGVKAGDEIGLGKIVEVLGGEKPGVPDSAILSNETKTVVEPANP
ncbi:MAG TPA: hypothetical protein ENI08_02305, partial [Candidatus Dependentiae bacterium]|nr:hypothetical protein [Candidatus Dependentiae bacterium]